MRRYGLSGLACDEDKQTVFWLYDLVLHDQQYVMSHTGAESATIDELFAAFRHQTSIPSKEEFLARMRAKIDRQAHLHLRLG